MAAKARARRKAPPAAKPAPRGKPGRKEHQPSDQSRLQVQTMAGYGLPQPQIALLIGISEPTLRKHYAHDLDLGEARATLAVSQTLFNRATKGNDLGAAIFWMKARAGWREKAPDAVVKHSGKVEHEHSGEVLMTVDQRNAVLAAVRARVAEDDDGSEAGPDGGAVPPH